MSTQVTAPRGTIVDVAGVKVGHHHRLGRGWQTGTTVVIVPDGATAGVDVGGGAPGTRETDAIGDRKLVPTIHGLCLSGGSAYGLRAADGLMDWLEERQLGFSVGPAPHEVVPVVPAAVLFDLGRGGSFSNRPDAGFGLRAARRASPRQQAWGTVGAGAGARAGGLQGGIGTASTTVSVGDDSGRECVYTVGALAAVNANGSVVDPSTGVPWEPGDRRIRRPAAAERRALLAAMAAPPGTDGESGAQNTTIGVVATDAVLSRPEVSTMASVAQDGLARAVRPAHSLVDGDTIFAISTDRIELPGGDVPFGHAPTQGVAADGPRARVLALNLLLRAAAETFADACTHAILAATTVGAAPSYLDLCPSVR